MNYKDLSLRLIEDHYEELLDRMAQYRHCQAPVIVIWGTGALGHILYQYLKKNGVGIHFFCDNDTDIVGSRLTEDHIPVVSAEQVLQMRDADIYIASTSLDAIRKQIKENGFSGNVITPPQDMLAFMAISLSRLETHTKDDVLHHITETFDLLHDEQSQKTLYFKIWGWFASPKQMRDYAFEDIVLPDQYAPDGIVALKDTSVIVDCGAYCGDTLHFFAEKQPHFSKYIGYELDRGNFAMLQQSAATLAPELRAGTELYNLGVGDTEQNISFFSKNYSSLVLNNTGQTGDENMAAGRIVPLDKHLSGRAISYLKMDIEGSEMAALRGARNLIRQNRPDCAICIYHKATDLWEIPLFLKMCCPDYRIYIRHHAACYFDTVCYAISDGNNK